MLRLSLWDITSGKGLNLALKSLFLKYKEPILYIFFGGLTTLVNWGVYALLADVLLVPYLWSTAAAQILAILFAYVTNRIWVFESGVKGAKGIALELLKFFGCRAFSFVLDLGCMYAGVDLLRVNDKLMKLLSNVVVVLVNYVFSKVFIFRKPAGKSE